MSRINLSPQLTLSSEEIESFRKGNLEIHCLVMKLVRPKPNHKSFSGSGFIKQTSDGNFEFVMYSKKVIPAFEVFKEMFGGEEQYRPGQLIPDTDYFTLTCFDDKGRKWIGEQIWPEKNSSGKGTILTGEFNQLQMKGRLAKPSLQNSVTLEFIGDFKIPANTAKKVEQTIGNEQSVISSSRNILIFEHNSIEYSFSKEINFLKLGISSKTKKFRKNYVTRVTEALQFVLGQTMSWAIFTKYQGKTSYLILRTNKQKMINSRPPISANPTNIDAFRFMFSAYLDYVLSFKGNYFHPISSQVRSIAQARSVNIETLALVLSISVESVLKYVKNNKSMSKEELEWISKAEVYFSQWTGPDMIKKRIVNFISATLKNPKAAKQSLHELVQLRVTSYRHKKAWDELRNKIAHGSGMGSMSLQEFLDINNTVLVLFYHLIFYIIGYKGKYIDYSVKGWPESTYPLDDKYI